MPDLDGFELAAMIREHPRFEKTAIIFVSAIQLTDLDRCAATRRARSTMCRCRWFRRSCGPRSGSSPSSTARPGSSRASTPSSSGACASAPPRSSSRPAQLRESEERLRLGQRGCRASAPTTTMPRPARFYWSPHLRRIVGMAEDAAADARQGARLRPSRSPRRRVPAHAGGPRTGGPPRARVQDRPRRTERCAGCWIAARPSTTTAAAARA